MTPDEARARVREAADHELVERLEHLDAQRAAPVRDDDSPVAPDAGATADYDVVLAGGGLSTLYAPMLARLGLRVAVFERARAATTHREWNASHRELQALARAGLFSPAEVDAMVVARYREGFCRWHGGGSYPVVNVLDHAVDAGALLAQTRSRAEAAGVKFFDGHTLVGHATGPGTIALRFRTASGPVACTARLMLDARGASSPSATADLVCPTVGGVLQGLDVGSGPRQIDPGVGEILVTTEHVEDRRQHIWEGFPGRPGETTVYLFYYDRTERVGAGALMALYARFFATLSRYKTGAARLVRPTFGFIPGWSRLSPAPRSPSPRIVLVGDAAARQSPLTYCGFGATLRSVEPAARRIAQHLLDGPRATSSLDPVVHDTPLHAGTGALAHMIASPDGDPAALNTLLDAAFATLAEMGPAAYQRLLRDEMEAAEFVRFLHRTSVKRPEVYPAVFRVLGAGGVSRWGAGIARSLAGALLGGRGP